MTPELSKLRLFREQDARLLGVQLFGAGRRKCPRRYPYRYTAGRFLNSFTVVLSGRAVVSTAKQSCAVSAGDVFFAPAREDWSIATDPGEPWEEYWITFHGDLMNKHQADFPGQLTVLKKAGSFRDELLSVCRDALAERQTARKLAARLTGLLAQLAADTPPGARDAASDAIAGVMADMRKNIQAPHDLPEIARRCGMSYSLFRRRFKKLSGLSPHRYLLNLRMQYARTLLAAGTPVKEAALRVGMDDPYHFSKMFKRFHRISPRHYAQQ